MDESLRAELVREIQGFLDNQWPRATGDGAAVITERRLQLAAQSACGPVFLFRELPAQFESSPSPLRLLLLPRPDQQLSVQLLKRRGPVLANPLLIDLPQPVTAIRLRPSPQRGPAGQRRARPGRLAAQARRRLGAPGGAGRDAAP